MPHSMTRMDGRLLTVAALPDAETAPTARLDCLSAFRIIMVVERRATSESEGR